MSWTEKPTRLALPGHEWRGDELEALVKKADGVSLFQAVCSGNLTVTTTLTDIAGCSQAVTVRGTTALAGVIGDFDFSKTAVASFVEGLLDVDGVSQTGRAVFSDGTDAGSDRSSVSRSWLVSLATGTHTIKLRAQRSGATGTVAANVNNTALFVALFDYS